MVKTLLTANLAKLFETANFFYKKIFFAYFFLQITTIISNFASIERFRVFYFSKRNRKEGWYVLYQPSILGFFALIAQFFLFFFAKNKKKCYICTQITIYELRFLRKKVFRL